MTNEEKLLKIVERLASDKATKEATKKKLADKGKVKALI